jgi:HPt (histidine-containing phosphotransfer) domain-containing protein
VLPAGKLDGFVTLCLNGVEGHLREIEILAEANDFDSVADQAHMLVSVAGNVGAMQASALARDLERACVGRDEEKLRLLREKLNLSCEAATDALRAWLLARSSSQACASAQA